jgi:hypothetical protein
MQIYKNMHRHACGMLLLTSSYFHRGLYRNIVLSGGSTMYKDLDRQDMSSCHPRTKQKFSQQGNQNNKACKRRIEKACISVWAAATNIMAKY